MKLIHILILIFAINSEANEAVKLPSKFDYNRIFVTPKLESGKEMIFYTDTGGGMNMVKSSIAKKASLSFKENTVRDNELFRGLRFPRFQKGVSIPAPSKEYGETG